MSWIEWGLGNLYIFFSLPWTFNSATGIGRHNIVPPTSSHRILSVRRGLSSRVLRGQLFSDAVVPCTWVMEIRRGDGVKVVISQRQSEAQGSGSKTPPEVLSPPFPCSFLGVGRMCLPFPIYQTWVITRGHSPPRGTPPVLLEYLRLTGSSQVERTGPDLDPASNIPYETPGFKVMPKFQNPSRRTGSGLIWGVAGFYGSRGFLSSCQFEYSRGACLSMCSRPEMMVLTSHPYFCCP